MKEYKIDIPVLLIFFCRDQLFAQVFEQVKKARPSKLYLYQDGAREKNRNDEIGIARCREICSDEQIDWDCEVHRFYQDKNIGCDPSEYIAQKWMFEREEMGIVLEDDDVPAQSFFPFCKELLEKYKDDERINMICGMNNYDINKNTEYSYFFSKKGSIWGWASWRRVLDTWDETYSFLDDNDALRLLRENEISQKAYDNFIAVCTKHRESGKAHYESINGASEKLYSRINIVPKYNMITNIGVAAESTHSVNDIRKLPKKTQKLFQKKAFEIQFPLKHPQYIMVDQKYDRQYRISAFRKFMLKIESGIRRICFR